MIIQVRGTSGSGKSTVVKQVMSLTGIDNWKPVYGVLRGVKRKKPLYYQYGHRVILGHYESPCGGCDTIGSAKQTYELIQDYEASFRDRTILCEGLLLSEDTKWSSQLSNLHILYLVTSLEVCLDRICSRRKAAGNHKPLNEENTRRRVGVITKSRLKLQESGAKCYRVSDRQAPNVILKLLRLHAKQEV